jgi:hypothetical protein
MSRELVTKGYGVVIAGDDALEIVAAAFRGDSGLLNEVVRRLLNEGAPTASRAEVLDASLDVLWQLRCYLTETIAAAIGATMLEIADNHLLAGPYDSVEQMAAQKAADAAPKGSQFYTWSHAVKIVHFARDTGAVPPEQLDPQRIKDEGHMARFVAGVPKMRQAIEDEALSEPEKVERVRKVMAAVRDRDNSPRDVSRMFRRGADRVPCERIFDGKGLVRWETAWMTGAREETARRQCGQVFDFGEPVVVDLDTGEKVIIS